jgi:hypothetical protein
MPGPEIGKPLTQAMVPELRRGEVSTNEQAVDDVGGYTMHPRGSHEARWASFNAGEFATGRNLWSLLPIAVWIAGGSAWLLRRGTSS